MHNDFPRLSNLESLKKQAKRWLASLDKHDARERLRRALGKIPDQPTLRDVQLALAREYGFLGWTDLKRAVEPDPTAVADSIALYETKAQALLDAYRTGTASALERHYSFTWHRREWKAMRRYVLGDLGKRGPSPDEIDIALDDARYLIAVEHGYENWSELLAHPVKPPRLNLLDTVIDAHGRMTDDMLVRVSHLEHVTTLRLGNSKTLTDEGVRYLSRMPQLRHLDLSQSAITDRGLEVLEHLPNLQSLALVFTRVSDSGIRHLRNCHLLEHLDLMWTRTGDGAVAALAGKQRMSHFISGNNVTDEGLSMLHDLPVFSAWHGGSDQMSLMGEHKKPNQIMLRGAISDRGLGNLRGLDGLFDLGIDSSIPLTSAGITHLGTLPHLGSLSIDARDESMPAIAALPHLRYLSVQDTAAGDDGFEALSKSQSIEIIWGRRTHNLHKQGFVALSRMPSLRGLSVSCLNVDDSGIASLSDFPALRELMPIDIPDAGYRHIGKCSEMESLVLMYCRDTTDAATEHIAGLKKLKRYFNSYTLITDRTPLILSRIDSLETVIFDACHGLTNDGVAALARLPRLKEVRMSGNGLTPEVVKAFPAGVKVDYSP